MAGGNPGPMRRFAGALLLSPGAPYGQARCTFKYVGAPGDPQVHLEIPRCTWRCTGAPGRCAFLKKAPHQVHLGISRCTWGYQRHHRRTFFDYVRRQGAPVERLHKPLVKPAPAAKISFSTAKTREFPAAKLSRRPPCSKSTPNPSARPSNRSR